MKIIALTDYKNRFGSKHFDIPYRSGMDKKVLKSFFNKWNIDIEFVQFSELINNLTNYSKEDFFIYTSSEDINYYYKSFIEDVVCYLELMNYKVIPSYKYLKCNNNKVFMELLMLGLSSITPTLSTKVFGCLEESHNIINTFEYPLVVKSSAGASSTGVFKANNNKQFINAVKKVSSTKSLKNDIHDLLRYFRHKAYQKESLYRNKYIVQNMIPKLNNDWKIYYFYDKVFIFYRPILKKNGFKASGGGYDNYLYGENAPKPEGIFDFAKKIFMNFNVPHASLDIAWDGKNFYLIEIQFVYFGTAGIPYSNGYYMEIDNKWTYVKEKLSIEEVYANSIIDYIQQ